MGLKFANITQEHEDEMNQSLEEKRDNGIIQISHGLEESFLQRIFSEENELNGQEKQQLSLLQQLKQIDKIKFFLISSICLILFDWFSENQVQGVLRQYQHDKNFSGHLSKFVAYGFGGLCGTIFLGFLLDVYNKAFTLRIAICSAIGLTCSYTCSMLYTNDLISEYVFMIGVGFFELSFVCTYQVGVPIVLVFDLMRYGDFSFLIIPLFSGQDRIVNALFNSLNTNPHSWTLSSEIIQPFCIFAMLISLMLQYIKSDQNFFQTNVEKDNQTPRSIGSFFHSDDEIQSPNQKESYSRRGTINNFNMTISADDEDKNQASLALQSRSSSENEIEFKISKKGLYNKSEIH